MRVPYYHSPILYTIFYNLPPCPGFEPSTFPSVKYIPDKAYDMLLPFQQANVTQLSLGKKPLLSTWTSHERSQKYLDASRSFADVLGRLSNVLRSTLPPLGRLQLSHERSQKYLDASWTFKYVLGRLSSGLRSTWTPLRSTWTPFGCSQMYFNVSRAFSEVLGRLSDVQICISTSLERSQKYMDVSETFSHVLRRL